MLFLGLLRNRPNQVDQACCVRLQLHRWLQYRMYLFPIALVYLRSLTDLHDLVV